jgi:DNA-binding response OmpR family regulator
MLPVYITGRQVAALQALLAATPLVTTTATFRTVATLRTRDCVTILSLSDSSFALCEVQALRSAGYPGKLAVVIVDTPTEEQLCQLYLAGIDNCVLWRDNNDVLVSVILALARTYKETVRPIIKRGNMCVDPTEYRVTVNEEPVQLVPKEYELLLFFFRNPDLPFTRPELSEALKGAKHKRLQTIDGYISRLRKKLEQHSAEGLSIRTEPGIGYQLVTTD